MKKLLKSPVMLGVFFVLLVFALAVAYALIASKIDEGREQTILNEKQRISTLEREPFEKCVRQEDQILENNINLMRAIWKDEARACAESPSACKRSADARWEDLSNSIKLAEQESAKKKDECYWRYK